MGATRRAIRRMSQARPVLLDVAGLAVMAGGIFLLETSRPGWWAVFAGVGLIAGALRAQT